MAHARRRHRDGATVATIAAELGLSTETIRRWTAGSSGADPARLVPVEVVVAAPAGATTGERRLALRLPGRRDHARRGRGASPSAPVILGTSRAVRVFAYPRPTDLRKGFDGLYGLVRSGLRRDVLDGELFLFVNRRRDACKVLLWDGTGLCIFQKRLERGRFAALWRDDGDQADAIALTASELALFIEGCGLVGRAPLSPAQIVPRPARDLVSDREV